MTSSVETPSGKTAGTENFPVGSWLLPAPLRPHVAAFYAFARAGDDIADNPALAPEDKIARLTAFGEALATGSGDPRLFAKAHALRRSLAETGVTARHGLDLLDAFKQDAVKNRYRSWDDLIAYCNLSAAPVGRYLLDLHGESRDGWPASDALCNALQVLNHLQDCQEDHREMDRVYLPLAWLEAQAGAVEALQQPKANGAVRTVLDLCLSETEDLLAIAAELPARLRSRPLAMESSVILHLARRLARLLRRDDPLAGRVKLSRADFAVCGLRGIVHGWLAAGSKAGMPQ
ncbi:MAG: squalene synthase HpnC [Rhodospirillaceae bacterium]